MNYNEYLQLMLDAALDIKAGNFDKRHGICWNIDRKVINAMEVLRPEYVMDDEDEYVMDDEDEIIMDSWEILECAFRTWPKFSGNVNFPINDPNGNFSAYSAYGYLPKWTGEYGALRFELLDHVIDFLKKEIESATRTA